MLAFLVMNLIKPTSAKSYILICWAFIMKLNLPALIWITFENEYYFTRFSQPFVKSFDHIFIYRDILFIKKNLFGL